MADPVRPGDLLLLDTHVWIWAVNGESARVPRGLPDLLTTAAREERIRISAISVWEATRTILRGRVPIGGSVNEWLDRGIRAFGGRVTAVDRAVAVGSVQLPQLEHRDPADRFLIATARHLNARLVTADEIILAYGAAGHVRVLDARR